MQNFLTYILLFLFSFIPFIFWDGFVDPFTTIKWLITLLSLNLLIFLFLLKNKHLALPKLPKISLYLLALTLFFLVLNSFIHHIPLTTYENLRRFLFWAAVILFFNIFIFLKEKGFYKIEHSISIIAGLFIFIAFMLNTINKTFPLYLTFGNHNLSAEFVLFSLAFTLGSLTRLWNEKSTSWFFNLLVAMAFVYIYLTYCRSAYIALVLIIISGFYFYKIPTKEITKVVILSIIISIMLGLLESITSLELLEPLISNAHSLEVLGLDTLQEEEQSQFSSVSQKNVSFRWHLYVDTLRMVIQNPLGVGIGQFEFTSLPYLSRLFPIQNENAIFLSPHNEFLGFLTEDGWIVSFLYFLLFCTFFFYNREKTKEILFKYPEFLYFSIILFIQCLFQFPLIEPYPYLLSSMILGFFFFLLNKDVILHSYLLNFPRKFILITLNFITSGIFLFYFSSIYISFHYPENEKLNKIACSSLSRDWFACLNVSYINFQRNNYATAEAYADKTLLWQPFNYQGMKLKGFALLKQGKTKEACSLFKKYNAFFNNQTSVKNIIDQKCSL